MPQHEINAFIPKYSSTQIIALDEARSPAPRAAIAYWRSLRGQRRFPARSDINPRDIAGLLPNVTLVKVEDGDFVYRIVGDLIVMSFGVPLQGRRLSDVAFNEPGFGTLVLPLFKKVTATGEPLAVHGKIGRDVAHANFTDSENVLLPLGPDGETVDHILIVSAYTSRPITAL